jgi:hypothetical protein
LTLEGHAVIQGKAVVRTAVPADDMMQAFFYRHLVPATEWLVFAIGRGGSAGGVRLARAEPVRLPAGGSAEVEVLVPRGLPLDRARIELSDPPEGISLSQMTPGRGRCTLVLCADAAKVSAGLKGNLLGLALAESPLTNRTRPPGPGGRSRSLGYLPAIPFEVVEP